MATATATSTDARIVPWWLVLLQGIAALIIGVLLLMSPGSTTLILIQLLGIYWFVSGIFGIVSIFIDSSMWGWKLFAGILGIIAGILIIQNPLWSTLLVPATLIIIFGIEGIIIGIVNLIQAFQGGGWGIGILGVVSIIFGIVLLGNVLISAALLPFVLGGLAIIGGIVAIIMAFRLR
jgi:uncharacterized membrane protein HdeD (DUF308 family)